MSKSPLKEISTSCFGRFFPLFENLCSMIATEWGSSTNLVVAHTGPLLHLVQGSDLGSDGVKYLSNVDCNVVLQIII